MAEHFHHQSPFLPAQGPDLSERPTEPLAPSGSSQRTWPAVLTLVFLAPVVGEMLSGSTPPLRFLDPVSLLGLLGLYGGGALVIRELVRRKGLDWRSLLLFALAYGVVEEGLVVMSWFNPGWPDLGQLAYYGRLFETSWIWAVQLTIYHAVVSIIPPIVLVEILFPRIAARSWLTPRGLKIAAVIFGCVCLLEFPGFWLIANMQSGYAHPPLMYAGALLLVIGLVWWGIKLRPERLPVDPRPVPHLWWLRLAGFGGIFLVFLVAWVIAGLKPHPLLPVAVMVAVFVLGYWLVSRWHRRASWSSRHKLALVSGILSFFILLTPFAEFSQGTGNKDTRGMTVVGIIFLLGLIALAWRERRRARLLSPLTKPGERSTITASY
ncbi:MAG: hypothetical protein IMW89_00915 [Ktedonobacteraceae bacterium]|nr:hypothetical protein [Ktedonobacteraceae bacterium]